MCSSPLSMANPSATIMFQHRQCLLDTITAFGNCLLSAVELQQSDLAQSRSEHDMRRLASETCPRDVVLHDIE